MKSHSIKCPACHKKSTPTRSCSKCGIVFEHWLSGQVAMRHSPKNSQFLLSRRYWVLLILAISAIVGISKFIDITRKKMAEATFVPVPLQDLDTPEKVLMEMARLANDKSVDLEGLKARLRELSPATIARPADKPSGNGEWENGLASTHSPKNLVRGQDWQGRKTFEIDNR